MELEEIRKRISPSVWPAVRLVYRTTNRLFARRPHFVIVGTGRCGTGYSSKYLSRIGIACSHEGYFTPDGPMLRNPDRFFLAKGDASWLAVPFVAEADIPVLHQVRDPRVVVRSLMQIGFFDPAYRKRHDKFIRFAERYFAPSDDPLESCIRWYLEWNKRCEDVSEFRFRIEDLEGALPEILRRIGYPDTGMRADVSSTRNAKRSEFSPEVVERFEEALEHHPLFPELAECGARYGYELPTN